MNEMNGMNGVNMKKYWVEEVGEKKMVAVLMVQVEQVGSSVFPP